MSYTRPPLDAADATWQGASSYLRPQHDAADASWKPGAEAVVVSGTMAAALSAPTIAPPTLLATEQPARAGDTLWARLPTHRPAPPSLNATAAHILTAAAAVDLPAPQPPAMVLRAWERAFEATLQVSLPPPAQPSLTVSAAGYQDIDLPDADGAYAAQPQQVRREKSAAAAAIAQQKMIPAHNPGRATHAPTMPAVNRRSAQPFAEMIRFRQTAQRSDHAHGDPMRTGYRSRYAEAIRFRRTTVDPSHQHGIRTNGHTAPRHAETIRRRRRLVERHQYSLRQCTPLRTGAHNSRRTNTHSRHPWQHGDLPAPGYWWPYWNPPCHGLAATWEGATPYTIRQTVAHATWQGAAEFVYTIPPRCPDEPVWQPLPGPEPEPEPGQTIIPIRRVYFVQNNTQLTRVADGLELRATQLSLSTDSSSWTWGFSASIDAAHLDDVVGDPGQPVELEATVNGIAFRLLAERVGRSRQFGKRSVTLRGRGIAARLAAPFAEEGHFSSAEMITAQQAAASAINPLGNPAGWSLDWQLTDWLIPAGIWSHQGTAMSAVQRVAEAAGGYVLSDPSAQVLHVLPGYPVLPWQFEAATPDYEIPADVATTEGIEWEDLPEYNEVYVSGTEGGILGRVVRSGTTGGRAAPMVTDALVTAADTARQRGGTILGNTGRKARLSWSLPVLQETGIIMPGKLVRLTEGGSGRTGIVRGVNVSAGRPVTRQIIEVEANG